jgi:hypothetical protein
MNKVCPWRQAQGQGYHEQGRRQVQRAVEAPRKYQKAQTDGAENRGVFGDDILGVSTTT